MKTTCLIFAAAAITASAQTPPNAGIVYQQAGVITAQVAPGGSGVFLFASPGRGIMAPEAIAGSPFSAVEQTHSLQVLGDGTRIERSESQQVYRDSMGRTRVENGQGGVITIEDPVEGVRIMLNPSDLTAQKMPGPTILTTGKNLRVETQRAVMLDGPQLNYAYSYTTVDNGRAEQATSREKVENLAAQNINGVLATGRQVRGTIPTGEIGNDRPIQLVSEGWYSNDLQMPVKSSNSDPRFGDSSFELTNILRSEPDPSLFQVPPGYTITDARVTKVRGRIRE